MVSKGFSCIKAIRASPRPSRVVRTRRSIFFGTGVTATFFFAAGQLEACGAVPCTGIGERGGEFLDIGRLFVRYLGKCCESALTVRRTTLTV
jgi:hypothetical protein